MQDVHINLEDISKKIKNYEKKYLFSKMNKSKINELKDLFEKLNLIEKYEMKIKKEETLNEILFEKYLSQQDSIYCFKRVKETSENVKKMKKYVANELKNTINILEQKNNIYQKLQNYFPFIATSIITSGTILINYLLK